MIEAHGIATWLGEHWPEAVSAIAATATFVLVLRDRRVELPLDFQFLIDRDRATGIFVGRLTLSRPAFGLVEIERVAAPGWEVAEQRASGADNFGGVIVHRAPDHWHRSLSPDWSVDISGSGRVASFRFWMRPRPSTASWAVKRTSRLQLTIVLKSARTLRRTITVQSNRID